MGFTATQLARRLRLAVPMLGILAAACGGASTHAGGAAATHPRPSSAEQVSFLRDCSAGVGAGALGDAAVCQCTLTQLEAQTNPRTFTAAVTAWRKNANGAGYRSTVAATIARCAGQQQIGPAPQAVTASASQTTVRARTVKISRAAYAKRFHWPVNARSMVHTCFEGTAVANGMSCALAQAIAGAFGEFPDSRTPTVRHLDLVDPGTGHVVSVACAVSGREDASPICNAPRHQIALLPPPHFSS
jgi:hypothetical protein